jgi:photosystem I P700 chlorophyll a apoprotein A2
LQETGAFTLKIQIQQHVYNTLTGAGTAILTFRVVSNPQTQSLWLTDIAHHLAIAVLLLLVI